MKVLAEIMRLRRACCHPRLVMEDSGIEASKLVVFSETIDELLENKHKILAFSQFVEDQASDRAHRLGQQRPATIYRLVTQDAIEERIVELHRTKRDLADSLLESAVTSGKLSAQELLKLIRE